MRNKKNKLNSKSVIICMPLPSYSISGIEFTILPTYRRVNLETSPKAIEVMNTKQYSPGAFFQA
jgi:hypothetical protein